MKSLIFIYLALFSVSGYGQKLHKLEDIDMVPLTLLPTIFDPEQDSSITFIEFLQDTTAGVQYEDKVNSNISRAEGIEKVYGVGFIGDFRIDQKSVSVIIVTHHSNGEVKSFKYTEKIDKLDYFEEFDWAMYSTDVEVIYNEDVLGS